MIESARCIQRNGDPGRAATHAEAVVADFSVLLDQFEADAPFDEHVIALEYLMPPSTSSSRRVEVPPSSTPSACGPSRCWPARLRTERGRISLPGRGVNPRSSREAAVG